MGRASLGRWYATAVGCSGWFVVAETIGIRGMLFTPCRMKREFYQRVGLCTVADGSDDVDGDVGGFGGECLNSRNSIPLASDGRNFRG